MINKTAEIELTIEDIDLIFESFKSYEGEPFHREALNSLMGVVIDAMIKNKDKEVTDRETKEARDKAKDEGESRARSLIMIKAKLLQARDDVMINGVIE